MTAMTKPRILAVDDEQKYRQIIQLNLQARGYNVLLAENGTSAIEQMVRENPDLVILDVKMPDMDGFEVCQQIREFSTVPIIMLTAMITDDDKIRGLELGADDYVTKPFSVEELIARVRAALRRIEFDIQPDTTPLFEVGTLKVDIPQRRVHRDEQEITLSPTEFQLLKVLIANANRIMLYEELLEAVWGEHYGGEATVLRQTMYRLRQKIESDPKNPEFIHTKTGAGYVFKTHD